MSYFNKTDISRNELGYDAWGRNKVVADFSLFHGVFTHEVSQRMWLEVIDDVESTTMTTFTSENGMLKCVGIDGSEVRMQSKRHPRYQPNKGHLYSNSMMLPDNTNAVNQDFGIFTPESGIFFRANNGILYAVRATTYNDVYTEYAEAMTLPSGIDLSKGNIFDIQMQWRGVGDIKFFVNQVLCHTMELLGTQDYITVSNPALPIGFRVNGIATMFCGCVDVTSEGGHQENRQYLSTSTSTDSGSIPVNLYNEPIIAIRVPDTFKGQINTRDFALTRITGYSDNKSILRVWGTRDATAITLSTDIWKGVKTEVQDDPLDNLHKIENLSGNMSIDLAKMKLLHSIRIPNDGSAQITNPEDRKSVV